MLLLCGCPQPVRPDAPPQAVDYRSTPAVTATASMRYAPMAGDAITFTIRLACAPDGRLRVLADKLDVAFLAVEVAADGAFTALLVREGAVTRGSIADPALPPLLRCLRLLADEARSGPAHGEGRLTIGADGLVDAKELTAADGQPLMTLRYGQEQHFAGVLRPERIDLTIAGDDAAYAIRVRDLTPLADLDAARTRIRLPAEVREIPLESFAEALAR